MGSELEDEAFRLQAAGVGRLGTGLAGRVAAKVGVGLAMLGALGCGESEFELPPTHVVHEGPTVRLHAAEALEVCGGTGSSMERTMAFFEAEMGLGQVALPIDVYALELEDVRGACGVGWAEVFGCSFSSDDGVIYASALPMAHELVHSYVGRARRRGGKGYAFFEEGLAVAYADEARSPAAQTDLVEAIGYASRMPVEHYPTAGRFVSSLIDEFGAPAVGRFVLDSSDSIVIEVPEDQTFELRMEDRFTWARPWVHVRGCARCDTGVSVVHDLRWGPKDLFLPAGLYVVSASFGARELRPETLELVPHEGYVWCTRADNAKDESGRRIVFDDGTSPEGCGCTPASTHAWMLDHREGSGVMLDDGDTLPGDVLNLRSNIYTRAASVCHELTPEGGSSNCLDQETQGGALDADADAAGFQHPPLVFGDRDGVQRCAPDSP